MSICEIIPTRIEYWNDGKVKVEQTLIYSIPYMKKMYQQLEEMYKPRLEAIKKGVI